jgi:glycosyltransferase involved in cell wall biosynthesis
LVTSHSVTFIAGQLGQGGAERQLYLLARGLKEHGWRVHVITMNPGMGDYWEKPITELGVSLSGVPRSSFRLNRLVQVMRILREQKPMVVHSWSIHTNIYASLGGALNLLPKRFGSERANLNCSIRDLGRWGYLVNLLGLNQQVLNSYSAADMQKKFAPWLSLTVIPNGVEVESKERNKEQICWNYSLPNNQLLIGSVSSLTYRKNIDLLLEAFQIVQQQISDSYLVICGSGPERSRLERKAQTMLKPGTYKFLGEVPQARNIMPVFDILAFPSLNQEGMPNSIMEASACGVPVLSTNVGDVNRIIDNERTGFVLKDSTPIIFARKLETLLSNEELRQKMGAAGRQKMIENFSVEQMVHRVENLYLS